ncbi:MAG: hypothetical protein PHQ36_07750 [Anaerolineales bacterium]|nr:hypothetical protein [Anaerolineales bacterium]
MFTIKSDVTRIDMERAGADVMLRMWLGKWEEGASADILEYIPASSVQRLLMQCEDAGFSCEICDSEHGRALRGEITRIDVMQVLGKWVVRKYPRGWTAKTRPLTERQLTDDEAKAAILWCKTNCWTVREFPGGARAWKGEVKPVRDASAIRRVRNQIIANFQRNEIDQRRQFDLAFDC